MSLAARPLKAPREHGQALVAPPVSELLLPRSIDPSLLQARRELVEAALQHTKQYAEVPAGISAEKPIFMAGHQPELFHPGVWFKNFLLSDRARNHGGLAINLIIDNDVVDSPAIRVPAGSPGEPRVETIPFDAASAETPYEERTILDVDCFESFDNRVTSALGHWIAHPLVPDLWRRARAMRKWTRNLGLAVASARHLMERDLGLTTLEVPLGALADQPAFHSFALSRLREAAPFRETYNSALHNYRRANHIRSHAHPVPDLAMEDGWYETPFWIWSQESPQRRRLFVRNTRAGFELTDRADIRSLLPPNEDAALQAWSDLRQRGIKIRPRALMTTMYARLVLSDLFLHGIGGAKYDEVTDEIIRLTLQTEPPRYLTATATVQLPLRSPQVSEVDLRLAHHQLRELRFHAERFLANSKPAETKRELLENMPPRGKRKLWHQQISRVNESLAAEAVQMSKTQQQNASQLAEELRIARLLGSREFSFCLFPADFVSNLLLDLSRANA